MTHLVVLGRFGIALAVLQQFHDALHLVGDSDLLRTLLQAFLAVHALIGPRLLVEGFLVAPAELGGALGVVLRRLVGQGQQLAVDGIVVIGEVAGDVNVVGTGHAVAAGRAGDGGVAAHAVGHAGQQVVLALGAWVEGRERADVLLQVLHARHATQGSEDVG